MEQYCYYCVEESAEGRVVGAYPQCQYIKGYTEDDYEKEMIVLKHFDDEVSTNLYTPELPRMDLYRLDGRAKLTNFLSYINQGMLLFDEKALKLLENFNTGNSLILPTDIIKRGTPVRYNFMYFVSGLRDYIVFNECEFKWIDWSDNRNPQECSGSFEGYEQYYEWFWARFPCIHRFTFTKIVLKRMPFELCDIVRFPFVSRNEYYFSEALKKAIESENLTGLESQHEVKVIIKDI